MAKRILVSAGDPSGDQLLSRIIQSINTLAPGQVEFVGLAGPLCQREGVKILVQSKDVAVVGAVEVIRNLKKIFSSLKVLSDELKNCDSLICVDFPDFNFRLARVAKALGKPVDYIVAPQVWAWRSGRMQVMKSWLRRLYPALPFEEGLFREAGIDARFMGHPLRDVLPARNHRGGREILNMSDDYQWLALLPGSRKSEIRRNLPLIIQAWFDFQTHKSRWNLGSQKKKWKGLLTIAQGWTLEDVKAQLEPKDIQKLDELLNSDWQLSYQSHASLMACDFGWITSGTASLEAAYYQLPHILLYKMNAFSIMILRSLSSYFSNPDAAAGLPNILLEKKIIPELLQSNLTPKRLAIETLDLLGDPQRIDFIKKHLRWIPKKLGEPGVADRIAADLLSMWGIKSA